MAPARLLALALGLAAAATATVAEAAGPPRVVRFSPEGTARDVQQVQARFSTPMVAFGDPDVAPGPFEIDCPATGTGRWVDTRTWVHDFPEPLPGGLRCRFSLRAGLESLAGRALAGARRFAFDTGGPAVLEADPWPGSMVPSDAVFLLRLDAAPDPETLLRHVAFSVEGSRDAIGVELLSDALRDELLAARGHDEPDQTWLALRARQRFPAESRIQLAWGPGVASRSGIPTSAAQRFAWRVRPPFRLSVRCDREQPGADCVPLAPIRLVFTADVPWEQARRVALVHEREGAPPLRLAAERPWSGDDDPLVDRVRFPGPFAAEARYRIELPADLRDDAGRPLEPPASDTIRTADWPPLAKFGARFGLLELHADPALPVALRGLGPELQARLLGPASEAGLPGRSLRLADLPPAELLSWLRRLDVHQETQPLFPSGTVGLRGLTLPVPPTPENGASELVGIPLRKAGLHLVEIESGLLGRRLLEKPGPYYVAAGALVTNLAVHLEWGRGASLVWVTSLDQARPVPGAEVTVVDCRGRTLGGGLTDDAGVLRLPDLPDPARAETCSHEGSWSAYDSGLLAVARRDGDTSFVHSSWTDGIEAWRFQLPTSGWGAPELVGHTVLGRTLLRAGETVHMKHVLRRPTLEGFRFPDPAELPDELALRHAASGREITLPLHSDAQGTALTEWAIPQAARRGGWEIWLRRREGGTAIRSGSFRVEAFRLPFMEGTVGTPASPVVGASEVPLDLAVRYLAGGAAADLPVTVRSELRPAPAPDLSGRSEYADLRFDAGPVAVGLRKRGLDGSCSGTGCPEASDDRAPVSSEELRLDASGTARVELPVPPLTMPRSLAVELEWQDPAGTAQTAAARVPLWPAARRIGVRAESGTRTRRSLEVEAVVLDLAGEPVADAEVALSLFEERTYTHRRRLVGGFYAYSSVEDVRPLGPLCSGRTDGQGRLRCHDLSPVAGSVLVQARSVDARGREAVSHVGVWLPGRDDDWFEPSAGDRMDLVPERRDLEPGEKARIRVKMPFREATALVSVARDGVGRHFVTRLSSDDPVVEVPVAGADAPNVFVSVLAVRGRVSGLRPTARIDLGRPAYRLGITELRVGWRENRLDVRVRPDRKTYRVRDKARVRIQVVGAGGAAPPSGSEVAVAAVDEALLELQPNASWELLPAMMGRRGYGVVTATAQGLVVGRRHFGLKAVPHGGGGGRRPTRELFETLLLWNGRVRLDARGGAEIEVPLDDSLTRFRIVAVATGGAGTFGTGSATVRTTQELMVLPGLPPVVRSGDRFAARFTLRNTTARSRTVTLSATVGGLDAALPEQRVEIPAGASQEVSWDVRVPPDADRLDWDVTLAGGGSDGDRLRRSQRVVPSLPVRVLQATLAPLAPELAVPVARPEAALPRRGGIRLELLAGLSGRLSSLEDYLRDYPFGCLEQRVSRAVGLGDDAGWRSLMADLPSWLDDDGLAKFFPTLREGSPVLTAYLISVADASGRAIPEPARAAMLSGLAAFADGSLCRASVAPAPDLQLRRVAAMAALARHGRVTPELVASVPAEPTLWPTSTLLDWIALLRRVEGLPGAAARLETARKALATRLVLSGTTLGFADADADRLGWLLASPDANAARVVLEALAAGRPAGDVARLVRGFLSRLRDGRFDTTFADAWGVVALDRFAATHESTPVTGEVVASLGGLESRLSWAGRKELSTAFDWPPAAAEDATLRLRQDGTGTPWALVQSRAALPLEAPLESGFTLRKRWTPLEVREPGAWHRGDLVKVALEASAARASGWVVLRDPIPSGATLLGGGLGGGSLVAARVDDTGECPCPAFVERGFEAFTQYWSWVPAGGLRVEYVLQLGQDGTFRLPPTRIEAMYAPEIFAELPNAPVEVGP